MTLAHRKLWAKAILAVAILFSIYIAIPRSRGDLEKLPPPRTLSTTSVWLQTLIDELNRLEILHILGHLVIFGGVALLLGAWGQEPELGSVRLAVQYTLIGAILMEAGQIIVGYSDDTLQTLLWGVTVDLVVDSLAVWLAIFILYIVDRKEERTVARS